MSDRQSNVLWPERFRVPAMDSEEAEKLEREVAEWDALISVQPHIQRLLSDPEDYHQMNCATSSGLCPGRKRIK
jgi:hypothetical protein